MTELIKRERVKEKITLPCPRCISEGRENNLEPRYDPEEGWILECSIHGKFYLLDCLGFTDD